MKKNRIPIKTNKILKGYKRNKGRYIFQKIKNEISENDIKLIEKYTKYFLITVAIILIIIIYFSL